MNFRFVERRGQDVKTIHNIYFGKIRINSKIEGELDILFGENKVNITFCNETHSIPTEELDFKAASEIVTFIQNKIKSIKEKVVEDLIIWDKEYLAELRLSKEDLERIHLDLIVFEFEIDEHSNKKIKTSITFGQEEIYGDHLINVYFDDDLEIVEVCIEG